MLAQRVGSAAVGVPLIILLILVGGWLYAAVAALLLAVAAAEFQHLRHGWFQAQTLAAAGCVALIATAAKLGGSEWFAVLLVAALVIPLVTAGTVVMSRMQATGAAMSMLWLFAGIAYTGVLGCTLVLLRELDNGRDWVFLAVLATFAADTAAYFTGRAIGSRPLAPRISPKKTVEGFIGGWAGGYAAVIGLNYWLGVRIDSVEVTSLGLLLPLAAALGDLLESALKRWVHVKDASELIPGHGGLLDRLDSLLLTVPLAYVFARWLAG